MIRRITCSIYRTVSLCLLFVVLVLVLKQTYPAFGEKVGSWIAGMGQSDAVKAITVFFRNITSGEGVKRAVEVFRETLQSVAGG